MHSIMHPQVWREGPMAEFRTAENEAAPEIVRPSYEYLRNKSENHQFIFANVQKRSIRRLSSDRDVVHFRGLRTLWARLSYWNQAGDLRDRRLRQGLARIWCWERHHIRSALNFEARISSLQFFIQHMIQESWHTQSKICHQYNLVCSFLECGFYNPYTEPTTLISWILNGNVHEIL